jgi:hypothetical protein
VDTDDASDSEQRNGKRRKSIHQPTGNKGPCRNKEVKYYYVEKILGSKVKDGVKMFLIKWKRYKDLTWEPAKTMEVDIPEMVEKFETSSSVFATAISGLSWAESDGGFGGSHKAAAAQYPTSMIIAPARIFILMRSA